MCQSLFFQHSLSSTRYYWCLLLANLAAFESHCLCSAQPRWNALDCPQKLSCRASGSQPAFSRPPGRASRSDWASHRPHHAERLFLGRVDYHRPLWHLQDSHHRHHLPHWRSFGGSYSHYVQRLTISIQHCVSWFSAFSFTIPSDLWCPWSSFAVASLRQCVKVM